MPLTESDIETIRSLRETATAVQAADELNSHGTLKDADWRILGLEDTLERLQTEFPLLDEMLDACAAFLRTWAGEQITLRNRIGDSQKAVARKKAAQAHLIELKDRFVQAHHDVSPDAVLQQAADLMRELAEHKEQQL